MPPSRAPAFQGRDRTTPQRVPDADVAPDADDGGDTDHDEQEDHGEDSPGAPDQAHADPLPLWGPLEPATEESGWAIFHEKGGEGGAHPALAEARRYLRGGWCVVPLLERSKSPRHKGWSHTWPREDDLPALFPRGSNIGVVTGRASGGLVDVDCDAPEAARAAKLLLPATGLTQGNSGAPVSHYWYVVAAPANLSPRPLVASGGPRPQWGGEWREMGADAVVRPTADVAAWELADTPLYAFTRGRPPIPSAKYAFAEQMSAGSGRLEQRTMLVELRADGCQTMVPPSIHPDGMAVRWEKLGAPAVVEEAALRRAVAEVAACALVARHWPDRGLRDEAALALAGMLISGGWDALATDRFTRAVALVAGDEEWPRRAKGQATLTRVEAGAAAWGRTALARRLRGDGARVAQQAAEWLGLRRSGGGGGISPMALPQPMQSSQPMHPGARDESDVADGPQDDGPLIELTTLHKRPLRWLWRGRLPLGKLTILDGDPGLGKSLLALDLIARVTTGAAMPDGSPGLGEPGGAVLLSAEDGLEDTVIPRLEAAGVRDLSRVVAIGHLSAPDLDTGTTRFVPLTLPRDVPWIERAVRRKGARVVVIDPLMAYLDGKVNSWRDQDVRATLAPLAQLAEDFDLAVLILRHLNKAVGGSAIYRGGGSIGLIGAARAGWLVAKDPNDPEHGRVLAMTKNNLGGPQPSLKYRIEAPEPDCPRVVWSGTSGLSADALVQPPAGQDAERATGAATAGEWLAQVLADGPRSSAEVTAEAAAVGITPGMLRTARKATDTRWWYEGRGAARTAMWCLPNDLPPGHGGPGVSSTSAQDA